MKYLHAFYILFALLVLGPISLVILASILYGIGLLIRAYTMDAISFFKNRKGNNEKVN
jgi:hypothetical protein